MTATYKDLEPLGYPKYRIGDDGSIWSIHSGEWKELKQRHYISQRSSKPYCTVIITNAAGKKCCKMVHTLVLEAFVGPCPEGMECCHANDIGTDNNLTNLRWDTHKSNIEDAKRNNKIVHGESHPNSRLSEDDVNKIRMMIANGRWTTAEIAKVFLVSPMTIKHIASGRNWNG